MESKAQQQRKRITRLSLKKTEKRSKNTSILTWSFMVPSRI